MDKGYFIRSEPHIRAYELGQGDVFSIPSKALKAMLFSFNKTQYQIMEHMKFIEVYYVRIWYKPSTWFRKLYKFKWE